MSGYKKPTIWFDMDGVMAKYDTDMYIAPPGQTPVYLTPGGHGFRHLSPDDRALSLLRALHETDEYVIFGLTNLPTSGTLYLEGYEDKRIWFREQVPDLAEQIPIIGITSDKRSFVSTIQKRFRNNLTPNDILVDDYKTNLQTWAKAGGLAFKYCNGINSPNAGKIPGILDLDETMTVPDMARFIHLICENYDILKPVSTV